MKSTVEHLNPTRVKLTVEVPFDELKPHFDKAYGALAGQVRIPGFRPGKVPARILDARLGRGTILTEATEACDARPDPVDVALAIERINDATTLGIRSVRSEWAGLRTFTADRSMVIGPEPSHRGFVWLVGQGGTGIQTAPAAGQLVAALVRESPLPDDLSSFGVDPSVLGVERLR